jgi:hypothetical protein
VEDESAGSIHKRVIVCVCDPIKGLTATLGKAKKESACTPGAPRFRRTAARLIADATL